MSDKHVCLACKGKGRKGYIKGYIFPCPYCCGKGFYSTKKEQRCSGLRSGDIKNRSYPTNLFIRRENEVNRTAGVGVNSFSKCQITNSDSTR